jgi:hypothetical protein
MAKMDIANVKKAVRNPRLLLGEIRKYGSKINTTVHKSVKNKHGTRVMQEDWDNLIILDCCRYDVFEEENDIPGNLRRITSLGSHSWEFMRENYQSEYHDTIYVSSNPYTPRIPNGTFFKTVNLLDDWDPEYETVLPEVVTRKTIEAHDEHPNKKLIIHLMQPHYPFIGKKGQQLSHRGLRNPQSDTADKPSVWDELQWGFNREITEKSVLQAYRENLQLVLDEVKELLDSLGGKSVITSDHGCLIGERLSPIPVKGFGHTPELRVPELTQVPWLEVTADNRRKIETDRPIASTEIDEQVINKRLKAFGYKE